MKEKISVEETVFVVRSVPVEEMDQVLQSCHSQWPEKHLVVITDFERHAEMMANGLVSDVVVPSNISKGFSGKWDTNKRGDILVVPVRNRHGVGYGQVFGFFRNLRVRNRYIAAECSELKQMSQSAVKEKFFFEATIRLICKPISIFVNFLMFKREPRPSLGV